MAGVRFTAYFSKGEDRALRSLEKSAGCSRNFLVRSAVRAYLGLDKVTQLSQLSRLSDNGGEEDE